MAKEKSINPAQAARKAEKAKAIKKSKAELASRRNEKFARKNPERLQKQLDELKAITSNGGKLTSHEQRMVEELEKEVKAVRKAREVLGDKAPALGGGGGGFRDRDRDGQGRGGGVLGKRGRDGQRRDFGDSDSDIPDDVKDIPMPRDTPPPIPKELLDKWYQARRDRWAAANPGVEPRERRAGGQGANSIPLGANARSLPERSGGGDAGVVQRPPPVEVKTVYEAAPQLRDLRKEAVAFVPAVVRQKLDKVKGKGGLVEPEEADLLERAGYLGGGGDRAPSGGPAPTQEEQRNPRAVTMEEVEDEEEE